MPNPLHRVPPAQRRLVALVAAAAVAAGIFAGVAIVLAAGQPAVRPSEYQPFEVGNAARLGEIVATGGPERPDGAGSQRPLFFADPTGGTRGFALALEDGDFVALHVIPPGGSRDCPVDWDNRGRRFEDCRRKPWDPAQLRRFPTTIDGDGQVVVDLRRLDDPPG